MKASSVTAAFIGSMLVPVLMGETRWWPIQDPASKHTMAFAAKVSAGQGPPEIVVAFRDVGDLSAGRCQYTSEYRAIFSTRPDSPVTVETGSEAVEVTAGPPNGIEQPPLEGGQVRPYARFKADAMKHGKYVVLFREGKSEAGPNCQTAQYGEMSADVISQLAK